MQINENYGIISGFTADTLIISQCQECAPVEDCDCHCVDDDD